MTNILDAVPEKPCAFIFTGRLPKLPLTSTSFAHWNHLMNSGSSRGVPNQGRFLLGPSNYVCSGHIARLPTVGRPTGERANEMTEVLTTAAAPASLPAQQLRRKCISLRARRRHFGA